MTDRIENKALEQVRMLCNHPLFKDNKIVIMPDVHPSKATVVGLACEIDTLHIIPQLLGNDLFCMVSIHKIKGRTLNDFDKLDKVIKNLKVKVPEHIEYTINYVCSKLGLYNKSYIDTFGTIGNGNHFISIEKGMNSTYLVIHSGSRNFGNDIALHFMKQALEDNCYGEGAEKQLSWLNEEHSLQYQDMMLAAYSWAKTNQEEIVKAICREMKWKTEGSIHCPHNYIDLEHKILHKGSIFLPYGAKGIIPLNMKDGSIIVWGNNEENNLNWLTSAPHGAGRVMSREQARETLDLKEFKQSMKDIHSNCSIEILDEAPKAYKSAEQILTEISPICEVIEHIKSVYNFKNY